MAAESLPVLLAAPLFTSIVAGGSIYLSMQHTPTNTIRSSYNSCFIPSRRILPTDVTSGAMPAIDNHLCFLSGSNGILKELLSDRIGVGALSLFVSVLIPLLLRLSYLTLSPNTRTSVLSPGRVVLISLLAAGLGWGPAISVLGVSAWAVGGWAWSKANVPRLPPVPVPANSVYLCNLFVVLFSFYYLLPALPSEINFVGWFVPSESKFLYGTISHLFVPPVLAIALLVVAPLLIKDLKKDIRPSKDREEARLRIRKFDANGVSYSFERIWGYYRKSAGAAAIFWWYGISRIWRGARSDKSSLTDSSILALFSLASLALSTYMIIALERATFRRLPVPPTNTSIDDSATTTSTSDVTPNEELATNLLLVRALDRAPAGYPWAEIGWKGTFLSTLVGGPGFALGMHAARGEEEEGWRCRREWREIEGSLKPNGKKIEGKKNK